jgi:1,4-dihydroxy-6-naphthoate synthase
MDKAVMKSHIDLYVNDFSLDLGQEGLAAVHRLFDEAEVSGIFPRSNKPLLAEK